MDVYRKSKSNREKFLKPYREKFETVKTEKAKAVIIAELISFDPSHLREPWVIQSVEFWLRNYWDYQDMIEMVFVKAPKKRAPTERQRPEMARLSILKMDIEKFTAEGYTVKKAIVKILNKVPEGEKYLGKWPVEKFDGLSQSHDLIDLIRKYYEKAKKTKQSDKLIPWPYFGRDVDIDEQGKIVISGGR